MNEQDRVRIIEMFRHRIFRTLFLKNAILFFAVFLLFWGVGVLSFRVAGVENTKLFLYALSAGIVVLPIAAILTGKRVPAKEKLVSILDQENAVGGLLMSSFETDLGDWSQRIRSLEVPQIRWAPQKTLVFAAISLVFAVVAFSLPVSSLSAAGGHRLNIDDQVKRLTTQLDVLEEENLLDVEEVESRKLELDKIQKDADGLGPVKTFDALDHISDRMKQNAAEAAEEAQRQTETLAKTEALMQQVKETTETLDDATRKSLMEGLAQSLEEMFAENQTLAENLKKMLDKKAAEEKKKQNEEQGGNEKDGKGDKANEKEKKDALAESLKKMLEENDMKNLTPEMLQQFCEAMKQCQGDCQRMCENLQNAGFPIDKEMLQKLAESQNVEKVEAQRMLSELWANCDGCDGEPGDCEGRQCDNRISPRFTKPQNWWTDPNTPPGDTRYEKEPDEEGAEFKAKFLPPADLEAFRNSQKIGTSISSPDYDPTKISDQQGGAILKTDGGIGSAHGQTIYPQHRGPVGRFFEKSTAEKAVPQNRP